jgi:uncharacterized membrane protein YdbT with pleckstrin-like domain
LAADLRAHLKLEFAMAGITNDDREVRADSFGGILRVIAVIVFIVGAFSLFDGLYSNRPGSAIAGSILLVGTLITFAIFERNER